MRCLKRNEQKIYYANYTSDTAYVDEYGNETGDRNIVYGVPTSLWLNVSPASGKSDVEVFGVSSDYTHTMVTCDTSCPIKDGAKIWYGIEALSGSIVTPNNYVVNGIAKGINSISYSIKEVSKS